MLVLAQAVARAGRQRGQSHERFGALRRLVEMAPPGAEETPKLR